MNRISAPNAGAPTDARKSGRRLALPALGLALGLAVTACGAANESGDAENASSSSSSINGVLEGAGSSAQDAAMSAWRAAFQQANPGVTVNYDPAGSGAGIEQFLAGGVDFAGSDAALTLDDEVEQARERCGGDPIEVPAYVSPIAVIFNIPGVEELNLDAATMARVFAGEITRWDDPAIADQNPDAELPSTAITAVHRSDESGTTQNFTDYLHQAAGGAWKWEADKVWPVEGGEAAQGTSGVVSAVKTAEGSIGYADESQARDLTQVSVEVGGKYVAPSAEGAAKALSASPLEKGRSEHDVVVTVDRATDAAGAYPVMLTSYLIACPTYPADTAELVSGLLGYVVSPEGQAAAAETAGSAPLPADLQQKAAAAIATIAAK